MDHDCGAPKLYQVHPLRVVVEGSYVGELLRYEVNAEINGDHEVVLVLESDSRCVAELVQRVLAANEPLEGDADE